MYIERRGEKVRLSLDERSDHYVVPFIAPHLGLLARACMKWSLASAWDRDLADRPVKAAMGANRVAELSEIIAARRAELIPLMLNRQPGSEESDALCSAGAAIAEVAGQIEPVCVVGVKQRIGGYALSLLNRSVAG